MARKVFYSFHYKPDSHRAAMIRSIGAIEGNQPAKDNDWESITSGGDSAIEKWIKGQLDGKSCCVVLIGKDTAGRKWINYEIRAAWESNKGVVGIYIHRLKNLSEEQSTKGSNPFGITAGGRNLSNIVKAYDPPYADSKDTYNYIRDNIATWIEEAITIRSNN